MANNLNRKWTMTGKPKIGGCLFRAPLGTPLPTDEKTALSAAFKSQGYLESSGFKRSIKKAFQTITAYGGDEVDSLRTAHGVSAAFSLIEVLNPDVADTIYGAQATVTPPTTTAGTKIAIAYSGDDDAENSVWVAEFAYKGKVKRVVLPNAQITTTEVTEEYKDDSIVAYPVELTIYRDDETGKFFFEYTDDGVKAA